MRLVGEAASGPDANCSGWTNESGSVNGRVGAHDSSSDFFSANVLPCNQARPILCICYND